MTEVSVSPGSLVFSTDNARLYQCDSSGRFILIFFGQEVTFRLCELIAFKTKVREIDLFKLFSSNTPDVELVHLPHCGRFFVFSILQLLELRELFSGAFTMLELNSIIHQRIIRNPV